jgi:ribosomal protein L24E
VGSGAGNVGQTHVIESMMVGQAGCSLASRAFNKCKPLQVVRDFDEEHRICSSDIHVMLALRRSPRQVLATNKQLDGTDMVSEFLGKRNAARTRRETRWRSVLLKRSM